MSVRYTSPCILTSGRSPRVPSYPTALMILGYSSLYPRPPIRDSVRPTDSRRAVFWMPRVSSGHRPPPLSESPSRRTESGERTAEPSSLPSSIFNSLRHNTLLVGKLGSCIRARWTINFIPSEFVRVLFYYSPRIFNLGESYRLILGRVLEAGKGKAAYL